MATNKILSIPQWLLVGSSSQPDAGYSSIFPKLGGPTGSWYVVDDQNNEKRLAFDFIIGAGISQSIVGYPSAYGSRLDIQIGGGLSYSQGFYQGAPFSVWGITPSMLAITGSNGPGYVLSTSTVSGEFQWVESSNVINGPANVVSKFTGNGTLTASQIIDTGSVVYIGTTPSNSYTFSVSGRVNIGDFNTDSYLHFSDLNNNYIKGELDGGFTIRTTDEFKIELFTNSSYGVFNFDNLGGENRTLTLLNSALEFGDLTSSKYLSASSLNSVIFGKTSSNFILELASNTQGAIKIQDGGQGSYSLLVSDSSGVGTWQKFYGYNGLTTSGLGIGLNLTNITGLTYSGGTFGLDYTKFAAPISVSNTFTVSLATVSVVTGVTYGSVFETPTFRVDQWGRIIGIGTVSTSAFTGPQGPTGFSFTWQGAYATSSTYSQYNVIEYDGSSYISLGTSSPGLTPSTVTQSWNLMASKGATGAVGSTGQGFTWQGTFSESITYGFYDVAYYDGSSYISVTISNLGNTPSNATQSWNIMALGSTSETLNITGTYGAVLVYGEFGWTALGPATAGYVLTTGGTSSLPYWSEPIAGSGSGFGTFSRNFDVVLNGTKSFGKYLDGQTIYSIGWTLEEFIYDVVTEVKSPIVNITIKNDPKSLEFGLTSSDIDLEFSYSIQNAGATALSGILEWSNDPTSGYTFLLSSTESVNYYTDTVTFDEYDFPLTYYYRYTVIDSAGGSASDVDQISVNPYSPPDISLNVNYKAHSATYGESAYFREYGNVGSDVWFEYDRQSELIDLESYSLKYKFATYPGTTYVLFDPLYEATLTNKDTDTIYNDHTKSDPVGKTTPIDITRMQYRVDITDERGNITPSSDRIVTFEPLYFFGAVGTQSWLGKDLTQTTRADLMSANSDLTIQAEKDNFRIKIQSSAENGGKLTFFTGYTPRVFIVAIPDTKSLTKIVKNSVSSPNPQDYGALYLNDFGLASIESYDSGFSTGYKIYRIKFEDSFGSQNPSNLYTDVYLELTIS